MQSLSASANCTNGSRASRTFSGIASFTLCPKLGLEHLGNRVPILFTRPRVALISSVRAATNASRARSTTKSCRTSRLRCLIGCNDCGSTRPSRPNFFASIHSFLRLRRQVADAVVSSDNDMLTIGRGVSYSLAQAAGPDLAKEAQRFIPVRPGRVVVTTAGKLPARFVFHAVTIGGIWKDRSWGQAEP